MSKEEQLLLKKNSFLEKELIAKNRELEIEASLEKVRARTMTMQKPSEFVDVINVIGEQFINLGFDFDWVNFSANGIDVSNGIDIWNFVVIPGKYKGADRVFIPYFDHPVFTVAYQKFKEYQATGNDFYTLQLDKVTKDRFAEHLFTNTVYKDLPDEFKKLHYNDNGYITSSVFLKDTWLSVGSYKGKPFPDEQNSILKRLGNTFGQAYTRFLDLDKAEAQAREAEIELSLERVRAVAMGMKQPSDMLEVCKIISEQLTSLDVKEIRNVQTAIIYEASHSYMNYEYYAKHDKTFITEVDFTQTAVQSAFADQMLKGKGSFFATSLEGDLLKDFIEQQKKGPEFVDPFLFTSGSLSWYWHSLGPVALGISTYAPLNENEVELFKRFRNVFELAYRRYLDIEKAEAQAREALIEAGLERVRARAMAMQKSDELAEAAQLLYHEFGKLGIKTFTCGYMFIDEPNDTQTAWVVLPDGTLLPNFIVFPLTGEHILDERYKSWKQKEDIHVCDIQGEENKKHHRFLSSHVPASIKEDIFSHIPDRIIFYNANFSEGYLLILSTELFSREEEQTIIRFAKVFEITYTRFLDLQKAEAQAREAQIEASLERVRSKTMAMHNSQHVAATVSTMFDEFSKLGIKTYRCGIGIMQNAGPMELWTAIPGTDEKAYLVTGKMDMTNHPLHQGALNGWKNKEESFSFELKGDDLIRYYTILNNQPDYPVKYDLSLLPSQLFHNDFYFNEGTLFIFSLEQLSSEESAILKRFAKVFGQTYRRFLDLQKAEAQARESQIQLALERVRARTMAMQHSSELQDAAIVLFEQVKALGFDTGSCGFNIWDKDEKSATVWVSSPEGGLQLPFKMPHTESEIYKGAYDAMKNGDDFFMKEVKGVALTKHFDYLLSLPGIGTVIKKLRDANYPFPELMIFHFAFFKQGYLSFHGHKQAPEAKEIFKRFAEVFEQTYTRFLDLQKAEAQSRESLIQLALERVRARTMAMQKSEELSETVYVLFQQFKELGENPDQATIGVINEDEKVIEYWVTLYGNQINKVFKFSIDEPNVTGKIYKAWKENRKSLMIDLSGDALSEFMTYRAAKGGASINPHEKRRIINVAFFSKGLLNVQSNEERSEESIKLLERFADVFEQTYTRFLDLEKAEAQAREAQIELGLERVRARAMAMHDSVELKEVVKTLFEVLTHLDVNLQACLIATFDAATFDQKSWMIHLKTNEPYTFLIRHNEQPFYHEMLKAWKERNANWAYVLEGETKIKWEDFLFTDTDFRLLPQLVKEEMQKPEKVFFAASYYAYGAIQSSSPSPFSKQSIDILQRFSKVFDSCYTRFLDLQKAEAQAREAEIQLALERVRARTMAMQKSDELAETAVVLFQQVKHLGIEPNRLYINIIKDEKGEAEFWITDEDGSKVSMAYAVNMNNNPTFKKMFEGWRAKKNSLIIDMDGEELQNYFHYLTSINVPFKGGLEQKRRVTHLTYFSKGFIGMASPDEQPAETLQLLERFAGVFNLTYTRFIDLQNAEAQARESQIELSLERVRAKTMAMHNSNDVSEATAVMFNEFSKLGIENMRCGIGVLHENSDTMEVWAASVTADGHEVKGMGQVGINGHPLWKEMYNDWKSKKESFLYHLQEEDKKAYYRVLMGEQRYGATYLTEDQPDHYCYVTYFTDGVIFTFNQILYNEEQKQILKRFATVFSLTYRRYKDLKKAEAQAKEAQIQLALERVRARTMAMQHSNELSETTALLFQQLHELGDTPERLNIGIINEDKGLIETWATEQGGHQINHSFNARLDEPTTIAKLYEGWKTKRTSMIVDLSGNELKQWIHYLQDELKMPVKEELLQNRRVQSVAYFKEGFILITTPEPLPAETIALLERFAEVFNLTYTRFLDLQKAEAQAREAQIELGLERVRARAMAMQKSDELSDLVAILLNELTKLDFSLTFCIINIINEADNSNIVWAANPEEGKAPESYYMRFEEYPFHHAMMKEWKAQTPKFIYVMEGREKEIYDDYLYSETEFRRFPIEVQTANRALDKYVATFVFSQFGGLQTVGHQFLSDENIDILYRFGKVFDLTYTRFNDLEKAEAQVRESQIQLALERVRARTMAMYKSEELPETSQVLFHQLLELGDMPDRLAICIVDEPAGMVNFWLTDQIGTGINTNFKGRLSESTVITKQYKAWKEESKSIVINLHGKELNEWIQFVREEMGIVVKDDFIKNSRIHTTAFFSHGWIMVTTNNRQTADTITILEKFASVFNLTYRRFLDLQKAESQAREAQIQLALERVRARTMAMYKSEELPQTAQVLFHQLLELGDMPDRLSICIIDETLGVVNFWLTDQTGTKINTSFKGRLSESMVIAKLYKAWKEQAVSMVIDLRGKELNTWIQFVREEMGMIVEGDFIKKRRVQTSAFFSHGWIMVAKHEPETAETISILERFASVFNLTYRRFLDLQKAEAQVREAEIEAALERVRSRSMGMQKSEDLKEIIQVVYDQFVHLHINVEHAGFIMDYKVNDDMNIWLADQHLAPFQARIPYFDSAHWNSFIDAKEKGNNFFVNQLSFEEKNKFYQDLFKLFPVEEEAKEYYFNCPGLAVSTVLLDSIGLYIENFSGTPYSDEENKTLMRFGKVFEQTYTRFLDLQKAEAQARESQIEAALEKVRSRSLAMHKSDEIIEVAKSVFEKLDELNIELNTAFILIFKQGSRDSEWWLINRNDQQYSSINVQYADLVIMKEMFEAKEEGKEIFAGTYYGEAKKELFHYLFTQTDFKYAPPERQQFIFATDAVSISMCITNKIAIQVTRHNEKHFSNEENEIVKRFTKVFDQSFTRFLDLQKAEAQAREAQIELGLERVRARAMAMQKSDELKELIGTVFTELTKLDLVLTRCVIMIYDTKTLGITWWMANSEDPSNPAGLFVKYHQLPPHLAYIKAWKERELKWQYVLKGKIKKEWDDFLFVETELCYLPDFVIAGMKAPDKVYLNSSFNSFGNLTLATLEPLSNEHFDILLRFAKVFDLTYTRFNDLQKAEAQAREAKIEAALERVRARTMAMYKSENLNTVAEVVFTELGKLELGILRCGIGIINKEKRSADAWITSVTDEGKTVQVSGTESMDLHPLLQGVYNAWLTNSDFSYVLEGEDLVQYYKTSGSGKVRLPDSQLILSAVEITTQYYHIAVFEAGGLFAFSANDFPEEAKMVMKRFAAVFNQSYTRFLDLQKAEAQTREAKIEASLERVRGKAMAMHSSRDLADTIDVFYHEMELLSVTPRRCGVGLMDKETHAVELSTMNTTEQGESVEVIGKLKLTGHPVLEGIYDNWILQKEYHPVLRGNEIKKYYQLIRPQIAYPDYPTDTAQYGYFFFFKEGGVYAWTEKELSEDELKIYRRFTSVLSLTYKRYKDLKDAEANGREAIKRASLDRVRAETASMRTTGDLEKITPLIWNELTTLNVPFIRCGVFIMDEEQEVIHSFLSTPEGKAIAAFQLPYQSAGELSKVLIHWHKNEMFKDHWNEATFAEWTKSLVDQGAIASEETYSTAHRPVNLHLHFLPFLQGMLYVGSESALNDEEINLVQNLADAFSTAYARYEDFNKLESAKEQIEKTLVDLKQAQAQLVQSEKMASLGELTAGIAHEIQNPLNFVNNFSDVNAELIDELNAERLKPKAERDEQLETEILNDIKENEQKINHHGKRADAIVKGMLQHSRKTSGQKEPTDINALADEYLRLSYHGLRAKDKTFNAEMKTDFDGSIGKINVIPQDIGRVLLNLFNNAFYAVNEQKIRNPELYKPTVSVATMKCDDKVQIIVKDNGNGIPQKVIDKIFQPFFTTKPTGEGTGLGLSLAYDIVKAHGGELKVESKENQGSEFVIQLPL
jgi:signal transduction histidine kinase/DNA-directed RNA polymerase subunit N (RpoN/RPB10)